MREYEQTGETLKGFDDFEFSLGDELRGERATRGKSLLDVQRDLHIKAAYVAAIENCDPSVFPNQGFVAGYVRSYARYLKLDQEVIFKRFCAESGFRGVNADLMPSSARKRDLKAGGVLKGAETAPRFVGNITPPRESVLSLVSPSGVLSVAVLVALIVGIGLGGWSVLRDIQRVEFVPVDQTPGVVAEIASIDQPALPTGTAAEGLVSQPDANLLAQLYRPQELTVPQMEPRDGPIAAINPDESGALRPVAKEETTDIALTVMAALDAVLEEQGPVVTVDNSPPSVELIATRAAWVRVYEADGTVLFEKILEQNERYAIPEEAQAPMLRAGNSGSVYLLVDGQAYGPVGTGTSVAKKVSLASLDVMENMTVATGLDVQPLAEPSVTTADNQ